MGTRQTLRHSLKLSGGATESIFQLTEALLHANSDYQSALEFVAARKKMDNYESMIDFLFCEINREWKMSCRRFYAGNGPALRDLITEEQIVKYDMQLVKALEVAHELLCENRQTSWQWFRLQAIQAARAA